MRFLPREEKFFAFFLGQVKIISEAAHLLLEGVRGGSGVLVANTNKITDLEHKGDEIIHEIFTRLNQTFITPLDPEDIHSLSSHLDDVLDWIEEVAHRLVAYRLDPVPPAVIELCEIVHACSKVLEKAFEALHRDQHLLDHCIEINRLEEEADKLLRREISLLFQNERDPIMIMKLKETYEFLEETTDRCEDVADVLQSVVVKNS
jgi:predicted phosphate transport protein (TIGR00153 family)